MKKTNKLFYVTAALAVICLILLCLLLTRKNSITVRTGSGNEITCSVEEAEKMANMMVSSSRSFLTDSLFRGQKLYVIGHKSPDLDTVGSAIAYARLLNSLGCDAEPRITMSPNAQTRFALKYCGIPVPEILDDAGGQNIVLVDISNDVNTVDNIYEANVVGILDHHAHNLNTSRPILLEIEPTGAAQTIVGLSYLKNGVIPDEQTAKLMALTILSDTSGLAHDDVTEADRNMLSWTAEIGKVNVEEMIPKLAEAAYDYTGMTDSDIYYNDYKLYVAGNDEFRYMIGIGKTKSKEEMQDLALRLQTVINQEYKEKGLDMMIAQIYPEDHSAQYLAVAGPDADYILQGALGDMVTLDEETGLYYSEESFSRKTVISPKINEFVLK